MTRDCASLKRDFGRSRVLVPAMRELSGSGRGIAENFSPWDFVLKRHNALYARRRHAYLLRWTDIPWTEGTTSRAETLPEILAKILLVRVFAWLDVMFHHKGRLRQSKQEYQRDDAPSLEINPDVG